MEISSDNQSHMISLGHQSYAPNYKPRDVVFESGYGSTLWDVDGNEFLDLGSGIGVNCLGHRNPEILAALMEQADRLWHTSNIYFTEPPVRLASEIVEKTFANRVFFCNSGAEANEAAIKVARKFAYDNFSSDKRTIITFTGSFHGRTIASVTATAQPKYHEGFGPLPGGFRYCEFNNIEHLNELFSSDVCAVMLEPIQGEGGIRLFSTNFLRHVSRLCEDNQALLICDEVQCGMGRTGKLFAHSWAENVVPDIITVAKAFGGGLPIGATLLGPKLEETLSLGSHGSTFGGNPICCAVARVVFNKVSSTNFLNEIVEKGDYLLDMLKGINQQTNFFSEIRGKGLMIGAEIREEHGQIAAKIMQACLSEGLLILQSGPSVIRLLPAFTIRKAEISRAMEILRKVISQHS